MQCDVDEKSVSTAPGTDVHDAAQAFSASSAARGAPQRYEHVPRGATASSDYDTANSAEKLLWQCAVCSNLNKVDFDVCVKCATEQRTRYAPAEAPLKS